MEALLAIASFESKRVIPVGEPISMLWVARTKTASKLEPYHIDYKSRANKHSFVLPVQSMHHSRVSGLRRWTLEPASRARFSSLTSWLLFSALLTWKSTLTGNEHSRACGCLYTRKKAAPLGVMCQRVRRKKRTFGRTFAHETWNTTRNFKADR